MCSWRGWLVAITYLLGSLTSLAVSLPIALPEASFQRSHEVHG